jgi:hypothetical protein
MAGPGFASRVSAGAVAAAGAPLLSSSSPRGQLDLSARLLSAAPTPTPTPTPTTAPTPTRRRAPTQRAAAPAADADAWRGYAARLYAAPQALLTMAGYYGWLLWLVTMALLWLLWIAVLSIYDYCTHCCCTRRRSCHTAAPASYE